MDYFLWLELFILFSLQFAFLLLLINICKTTLQMGYALEATRAFARIPGCDTLEIHLFIKLDIFVEINIIN